MNPPARRFDALAIADGDGLCVSPGSILIQPTDHGFPATLLAVGCTADVARHPASGGAIVTSRPGCILIPGLVNAHTHLDLTHIGPRPHDPTDPGGFVAWIDMIRANRATDSPGISASVRTGVNMSLAGGVVAVGDIAGAPQGRPSLTPWKTLAQSPLLGTSYLEFFALGQGRDRGLQAVSQALDEALSTPHPRVRLGLQPHAPTTVEPTAYAWAADRALPLSTHLAETAQEHEFIASGGGPQRAFLERLGLWDDRLLAELGHGLTPVAHLAPFLRRAPGTLLAHVNDASDADLAILATTGAAVAYCPRASAYFGADRRLGPHRFRDMLAAGIPVALGTDSIVNLPAGTTSLSTLDELRFLYRRDRTDPTTLLRMTTTTGAAAIGLDPGAFRLGSAFPHPLAGLVAVPIPSDAANPLEALAATNSPPELLFAGSSSGPTGFR